MDLAPSELEQNAKLLTTMIILRLDSRKNLVHVNLYNPYSLKEEWLDTYSFHPGAKGFIQNAKNLKTLPLQHMRNLEGYKLNIARPRYIQQYIMPMWYSDDTPADNPNKVYAGKKS